MAEKKTFYITTPIFYPNAKLHLGHAYTTTISDILARYHRLEGDPVYFLTGSDENAQTVIQAAQKAGKEPLQFLDEIVAKFSSLFKELNISYDQFIRTTDQQKHWPGAQLLWKKLDEAGDLYEKEYEGLYCVGHEAFITEKDLVEGKCPDHGSIPERIKEKNYFFRLSKYTDEIRKRIESDELCIIPPSRKNEILSFISQGLEDISFSRPRRKDWPEGFGVPVPGDDSQIMYVWCDALANYITALGYGRDDELYRKFWPADAHVIGKDILRFHAAIWPGMLLSAGLPLPKSVLVHGFITSGGKKMSKTLGNVIDPEELIAEYGADAVRYYLARHISPFEDGDITREGFKEVYNGELANGLGNLASRIMQMAIVNLEGSVEITARAERDASVAEYIEHFQSNNALAAIWERIGHNDALIALKKPFTGVKSEKKEDRDEAIDIIKKLVNELHTIAVELEPFMPETAHKIKQAIQEHKKPENLFPRKE